MAKNKNAKRKIARKIMSKMEVKYGVPVYDTHGWLKRKLSIRMRVMAKQGKAHERALARSK